MLRRAQLLPVILAIALSSAALAQNELKPLDPNKARANYSFAVRPGVEPFRFQVNLDKRSTITGVSVFRKGQSGAVQTLPACEGELKGLTMTLTESDSGLELLKHADFDFDGFEDLQLLRFYSSHLAKSYWCVYTWDQRTARFRYAPEIPGPDPVPHPESKTITVHQDFQSGPFNDRAYQWKAGKVELIEESGATDGSTDPKCASTWYCMRPVNGEMVVVTDLPFACNDGRPDPRFVCPATPPDTAQRLGPADRSPLPPGVVRRRQSLASPPAK
jgi:hypothetical protein